MLTSLGIRDVVLIDRADLPLSPGLTVLTGETGAGKSVVLGAFALALGAKADASLVRLGAAQAQATAVFEPPAGHPASAWLADKGLGEAGEPIILRRTVAADGRSRAFINDQPAAVGALRELGGLLVEVHGQHEATGLLDSRGHAALLEGYGGLEEQRADCAADWRAWREASALADRLEADRARAVEESEELALRLAELDRLAPRPGEDAALAAERSLLGAAGKALAELALARDHLADEAVIGRIAQAGRAAGRAAEQVARIAGEADGPAARIAGRLGAAVEAVDRALIEATEAAAALDAAADAFDPNPGRLDAVEERLFALRGLGRKLGVEPDALADERARLAETLLGLEAGDERRAEARAAADGARARWRQAAERLGVARRAAAARLGAAVAAELAPLKLGKARFRVAFEPLEDGRAGPGGLDRVSFEIATLPGAPFGPLEKIASGGELARISLALKAALAEREAAAPRTMIFDEVDQGVGGAVADAVGQRLARLALAGQVIVVTHSPQVAARADSHWRLIRERRGPQALAKIEVLGPGDRQEEVARMLAGATVTDAARAAARALIDA